MHMRNWDFSLSIPKKRYKDTPLGVFHHVVNHCTFASDIQLMVSVAAVNRTHTI